MTEHLLRSNIWENDKTQTQTCCESQQPRAGLTLTLVHHVWEKEKKTRQKSGIFNFFSSGAKNAPKSSKIHWISNGKVTDCLFFNTTMSYRNPLSEPQSFIKILHCCEKGRDIFKAQRKSYQVVNFCLKFNWKALNKDLIRTSKQVS